MQQETQWRLLIQIRINQIVKIEFLLQYSLNLNGFHIITAFQSYVVLQFYLMAFVSTLLLLVINFYKHKYFNNDHLTWILIGKMSGAH